MFAERCVFKNHDSCCVFYSCILVEEAATQ
jgi:hypothetical protein